MNKDLYWFRHEYDDSTDLVSLTIFAPNHGEAGVPNSMSSKGTCFEDAILNNPWSELLDAYTFPDNEHVSFCERQEICDESCDKWDWCHH